MKKGLIFILSLLLVACSSGKPENISTITGKEKLVVAFSKVEAPYIYRIESQDDHSVIANTDQFFTGYDIRMVRYLASSLNRELEVKQMNEDEIYKALANGEVDLYVSALHKNKVDQEKASISEIYYQEDYAVLIHSKGKCTKFKKLSQFAKKKLSSLKNSEAYQMIDEIKNVKKSEAYDTYAVACEALKKKEIDGIVMPVSMAKYYSKHDKNFKMISFKEEGFSKKDELILVMAKDMENRESEAFEAINNAIKNIDAETKKEWMDSSVK